MWVLVTGRVWKALLNSERLAILKFASDQNQKRWVKKKAAGQGD